MKKPSLTPVERLSRVEELVNTGQLNRAIARQLGVDEATIRRDRKKLLLHAADCMKVDTSATAEPLLRVQKPDEESLRKKRLIRRLERQRKNEKLRAKLAVRLSRLIFKWLLNQPLVQADAEMILSLADQELELAPIPNYEPLAYKYVDQVIEEMRPSYEPDEPEMMWGMIEWLNRWLARWVWRLEPDSAVRSQAMDLARSNVSKSFMRSQ